MLLSASEFVWVVYLTQLGGGRVGSGRCDRNGCFARVGGPKAPGSQQHKYGPGKDIDSARPFDVTTSVDGQGAMTVRLSQRRAGASPRSAVSFDRHLAGNPQGHGVPQDAMEATKRAQGESASDCL